MNRKGFTLVELLVVFVIIAFIATLMVPGLGKWLPRYRLRAATRDVVSTLRDAQMKAVSRRLPYQVDFNVANSYILQYDSGGWKPDGAAHTLPSGIILNVTGLVGGKATFNLDSTCSNDGNITLSYQENGVTKAQKGISISAATGRIRTAE